MLRSRGIKDIEKIMEGECAVLKIVVSHAAGTKSWAARIVGLDKKFILSRVFLAREQKSRSMTSFTVSSNLLPAIIEINYWEENKDFSRGAAPVVPNREYFWLFKDGTRKAMDQQSVIKHFKNIEKQIESEEKRINESIF